VATELGSRASRAAVAEVAHLGEVVLLPPAARVEGGADQAESQPESEPATRATPRKPRTKPPKGERTPQQSR